MEGPLCGGTMVWRDHGVKGLCRDRGVKRPWCEGLWCEGTMVWRDCGVMGPWGEGPYCEGTVV